MVAEAVGARAEIPDDDDLPLVSLAERARALRAEVSELKAALDAVGAGGGAGGGPRVRAQVGRVQVVGAVRDAVAAQAALAGLVTQMAGLAESTGAWRDQAEGARSFADWLGRLTRHGTGGGRRMAEKVKVLQVLPAVKEAASTPGSGVGDEHVAQVARVLEGASPDVRRRVIEAEEDLLAQAIAKDAAAFGRDLRARVAALEADAADARFEQAHARRFLRLVSGKGVVRVEGLLDPVAGEAVRRALEALTPVPGAGDARTSEQLSADALSLLAGRVLSYGEKTGGLNRPHVTVVMREETMLAARARQRLQRERAGGGSGGGSGGGIGGGRGIGGGGLSRRAFEESGLVSEPPLAQLEDGTALPPAAVEAVLCDAEVQRLVLDPAGQVLDVGTATRSFTKDLRVAITRRDRHCQFPGCALRASWCETHHIHYWSHGGATSLANGITLCSFHHHRVHADAIAIRPTPDGFEFTNSSGRGLGRTTRMHDPLLIPRALGSGPSGTGSALLPGTASPPEAVLPPGPLSYGASLGVQPAGDLPIRGASSASLRSLRSLRSSRTSRNGPRSSGAPPPSPPSSSSPSVPPPSTSSARAPSPTRSTAVAAPWLGWAASASIDRRARVVHGDQERTPP